MPPDDGLRLGPAVPQKLHENRQRFVPEARVHAFVREVDRSYVMRVKIACPLFHGMPVHLEIRKLLTDHGAHVAYTKVITGMTNILVGVDLKTAYDWLVVRACGLARSIGGRVHLLYVADRESDSQRAKRRQTLEELLGHLGDGRHGDAMVIQGEPRTVLREQSGQYDLLVVGPREPAGWRKLLEDAMAVQVIAGSRCPVFVPRTDEPGTSFGRILMGLNLRRDDAGDRLKEAGEWASVMQARLDVVFCELNPARYAYDVSPNYDVEERWLAAREDDQRELDRLLAEKLPSAVQGKVFLLEEEPGRGLIGLSANYDLVIVGSADVAHPSILLGSVTVDVVRHAQCDVLTLPV